MVPKSEVATECFSCSLLDFSSSILSSIAKKATKIIFPNFRLTLIQESKFLAPPSQATAYNHPNVFTFILLLTEGRTSESWEPSNKRCSFSLLTKKCLSLFQEFSHSSTLVLSSYLSVSLCVWVTFEFFSFPMQSVSYQRKVSD
jgi:hypothetical protein